MRLTDEEIKKMKNAALEYANQTERTYFEPFIENGILRAKDFYENQKCYNCKISDDEKFPENHIWCNYLARYCGKDFSCGKWEPRT